VVGVRGRIRVVEPLLADGLFLFCPLPLSLDNLSYLFTQEQVVLLFLSENVSKIFKQRSDHAAICSLELASDINIFLFVLSYLLSRFSGQQALRPVIVRVKHEDDSKGLYIFALNSLWLPAVVLRLGVVCLIFKINLVLLVVQFRPLLLALMLELLSVWKVVREAQKSVLLYSQIEYFLSEHLLLRENHLVELF